ncbi:MAG: serine/threonine-protein kinase [Pirellulales bacterium]
MTQPDPSRNEIASERGRELETQDYVGDFSESDDGPTVQAPSFPMPAPPLAAPLLSAKLAEEPNHKLPLGTQIDDFELLRVLGAGAFGTVYLARQLSLERQVALKIAANRGSEGRTMARLEHEYIVQVFSEAVDQSGSLRLLCMQLVPGAALDNVIADLRGIRQICGHWNGNDFLATVEGRAQLADTLDASALRDRQQLEQMDEVEATAWLGARLAEALDYAHQQDVLHRDIKPANILVNRYGRPLLADFNISFRGADAEASREEGFGGTLAYMAPEHLDAFNPDIELTADAVDERSDVYSLGLVIYELLMGTRPHVAVPAGGPKSGLLRTLAEHRRAAKPPIPPGPPDARKTLFQTIARSLAADPADRYKSGAELGAALDGSRELRRTQRELPRLQTIGRWAELRPFRWLAIFALVPQFIGSAVNISYNTLQVVTHLTAEQQTFFNQIVLGYNAIVYPFAVVVGFVVLTPLYRTWKRLHGSELIDPAEVALARRAMLRVPLWLLALGIIGWIPGGILFPTLIHLYRGPLDPSVFLHFATSFTLSGLIAIAYSLCGLQFLALRIMYPRMWVDATNFRPIAREELASTPWRLWLIDVLAGSIPSLAAVVLLLTGGDSMNFPFRLMIICLLVAGTIGFFQVVMPTTRRLARVAGMITGGEEARLRKKPR